MNNSVTKNITEPTVIALGYFDGVHLGHKEVIEAAVKEAKKRNIKSAVFTFTDDKRVSKKALRGVLYSADMRRELISRLGVDLVFMPDFSQFCSLSPKEFVELLSKKYFAVALVCGEDYKFGKMAQGDIKMLKSLACDLGIEVFVQKKVEYLGQEVSSSRICKALEDGKISLANKLLGRNYSFKSEVVSGKHIGSKSLFPTINQKLFDSSVKVKNGVYSSKVLIDGERLTAVTNIGVCPTVQNTDEVVSETYIIDKDISLYGKSVEVELIEFLRDEKKFNSIKELKEQISMDVEAAKKY